MTTIDTITDRQIANLQDEAAAAGDHEQVAICERALQAGSGIDATDAEAQDARRECARVIAAAEALEGT